MKTSRKCMNICYLIVAVLFVGMLSGCSTTIQENKVDSTAEKKLSFTNITPQEAKKRLDSEKGIVLLDVRTKEEFGTGHIGGAILIPVDKLEQEASVKLKDKEAPIFVYCRSGNRSVTAANILVKQGYKNVYNLGGIISWPYEVEK